jgi:hypothetical protein
VIEGRVHHAPVRRVQADHAHATAHARQHPGLGQRLVVADVGGGGRAQRLAEVADQVGDADAAGDGDAVPAPFAVVGELVARAAEDVGGRIRVGQLGLLHQQHVGSGPLEPPRDLVQAGPQRVDVPGRDPHVRSCASS